MTRSNTRPPSILLVEDSPPHGLRFKASLENNGCQVDWVETGLAGLKTAREKSFDLIILDVELPDIDGFQVCHQLKADPTVADIPVVMLTTHDRAEDALIGLDNGAVDYIPKDGFAEAVLAETIRQMNL